MKLSGSFRAYSASTDDARIKELFVARFGYEPLAVVKHGPVKLAGPLTSCERMQPGEMRVTGEVETTG